MTGRWPRVWRHRRLLIEAALALLRADLQVRTHAGAKLIQTLGHTGSETLPPLSAAQLTAARDIGWTIELLAVRGPLRTACLGQALAAQTLLRRRNIPCLLTVGLRRRPDGILSAHAWLRVRDHAIVGGRGREDFTPLAGFR